MSRIAITTSRTWLPQWTSLIRQLGEGGKELAVAAGAEGVGAAGAVDAGVKDGAWVEAAVAGAGAGTGVGVGAEEAAGAGAGVEAEQELVLDPVETLSWVCSDGPLAGEQSGELINSVCSSENTSVYFCSSFHSLSADIFNHL